MSVKIAGRNIGKDLPTFIIAEAGINHNGKLDLAKKLIIKAKECGADAVKFQTFKANRITTKKSKLFRVLKNAELEDSEFGELSDFARSNSIIFFSTASTIEASDLLSNLNVPAFKISSGNLTNLPLVEHIGKKKKPIIISSGMSNLNEVKAAVKTIESTGNKHIIILHCVSSYPTPPTEVNLKVLDLLQQKFNYPIGYSDHTIGEEACIAAVSVGAAVIEKHFTLDNKMRGHDHKFSIDPHGFKRMNQRIRLIEKMMGDGIKKCQPSELSNKSIFRRSVVADITIKKGEKITLEMLRIKRPATGIQPKYLTKVIGKISKKRIPKDTPLQWKYLM